MSKNKYQRNSNRNREYTHTRTRKSRREMNLRDSHESNGEMPDKLRYIGTFEQNRNFGFVVPDIRKGLETDIFIPKKYTNGAKNGQKVLAEITKPSVDGKKAEGKILEVITNFDQIGMDMLYLIKEYELPNRFPKEVEQEAKSLNNKVDKKDIPNRVDFRDLDIFTIDGEDTKDFDDAISIEKLPDGTYKLGVHIADVSYYVKEGSELDKEARHRGTSIYMLDRVIPMLPIELSNGICSLNAGEDRFTLSIVMNINKDGIVTDSTIAKGIINVCERMTYTNVAKILDGEDKEILKRYEKYVNQFKLMEELAKILKTRRDNNGSLNLNIPETKIVFDEEGRVVDIKKYELSFANEIIEQFMLTANEEIAESFCNLKAPFIYRVHETPDLDKIEELNQLLFDFGYKVKATEDNVDPREFSRILEDVKGKKEEKIVSTLVLRTLKIARYENENKGHFGIASKYYCHFTSPIRRYPDLFIHRVISAYLENNNKIDLKAKQRYFEQSSIYAELSSEKEKRAQTVEREAEAIKKAEFMEDKIGEEYEGIISGVTSFGIFVELENTVEGLIRFDHLGDDYFIFDEERRTLIGEHKKEVFRIGDKVKVRVIEANKMLRRVSFERVIDNQE